MHDNYSTDSDASGRDEAVIIVMGPNGSGKSSFINLLTNDPNIRIGHTLESKTDIINISHLWRKNRHVTLVDTPGFNDSRQEMRDTNILRKVIAYLKEVDDDNGRYLAGIVYLYRISDPRMGGASRANFHVLRKICGTKSLKNVVVATTYWDRVKNNEGLDRMEELQRDSSPFQPVVSEGGKIMRHDNTLESAYSILDAILSNEPTRLLIQEEMAQGKMLYETAAGLELGENLTRLIQHQKALRNKRGLPGRIWHFLRRLFGCISG